MMKSVLFVFVFIAGASAFPQAGPGCGVDSSGLSRQPGDSWKEDCNRCRCLTAGIPGCTKKFCGDFSSIFEQQTKVCKDSLGDERKEGEKWTDGDNVCSCGSGVVVCTALIAITDVRKDSPSSASLGGVNFPVSSQQVRGDPQTCIDGEGRKRREGETWKEECNTCGCNSGLSACTEVFCVNIELDVQSGNKTEGDTCGSCFCPPTYSAGECEKGLTCVHNPQIPDLPGTCKKTAKPLFSVELSKDVSNTAQCKQAGVQNCRAVNINLDYLETSVNPGDSVNFLTGTDVSMKLRRTPSGSPTSTQSYSFSLSDGGEATITVRPNKGVATGPSVFGSIKPVSGSVIYSVESCGQGCNVIYERDIGFFNQFED